MAIYKIHFLYKLLNSSIALLSDKNFFENQSSDLSSISRLQKLYFSNEILDELETHY